MVVAASEHAAQEARVRRACAQLPGDEWRAVSSDTFVGATPAPVPQRARRPRPRRRSRA